MKLTPSKNAEKMAIQYLQHEFRKILNGIESPSVWKLIDKELERFSRSYGEESFWNLVAAISEDWKLKSVFRMLSDTKFNWKLGKVPINKIVLTGMSPIIDSYTIKKFNRNPESFKKAWFKNKKMRQTIIKTGFSTHKERDHFPIFVWKSNNGYHVFDGMRRTLISVIGCKKEISAWIGQPVHIKGKPLLSGGFGYVLSQVYAETDKSDKINHAMRILLTAIAKNRRNGKDLFKKRIAKWSHDKKIKKLFSMK